MVAHIARTGTNMSFCERPACRVALSSTRKTGGSGLLLLVPILKVDLWGPLATSSEVVSPYLSHGLDFWQPTLNSLAEFPEEDKKQHSPTVKALAYLFPKESNAAISGISSDLKGATVVILGLLGTTQTVSPPLSSPEFAYSNSV